MKGTIQDLLKDRKTLYLILSVVLVSVFSLTIVYAALSVTLNITGNSEVVASSWDIHLENVKVTSGSVSGTTLNLIKEKKVIEYGEVFEVSEERGKEILKSTY